MDGYTLGTLLVGTVPLVYRLGQWLGGLGGLKALRKAPVKHLGWWLPFVGSWVVGALVVMAPGGFVAWLTGWTIWGAGWLGDGAYVLGMGGERMAAPFHRELAFTPGGLFIACLAVGCYAGLAARGKGDGAGLLSGLVLSLSAGVAGTVAIPLASTANALGFWWTGA